MTQVDELVAQARAALEAGDRLVARGYWRRATRVAPDRLDIWLDLYRVTDLRADRKRCLEHIIELDPGNAEAQADLAQVVKEEIAEAEALETEESETDASLATDSVAEGDTRSPENVAADVRSDITDEMRRQWDEAIAEGKPLVCINHPQNETTLRCNRCGAPICPRCVVRTPVGFRCQECIKAQQSVFFNAEWYDYLVAAFTSLLLSVPAAVIAGLAGWWFAIIISPIAGGLLGGIVHWAVGRRHGRWIWLIVGVCIVLGALVVLITMPSSLISIGIYVFTATGAAVGVLRLGRSR